MCNAPQVCCITGGGGGGGGGDGGGGGAAATCVAPGACMGGITLTCSGTSSCPSGDVCCGTFANGAITSQCQTSCMGGGGGFGGIQLCNSTADCPAGDTCVQRNGYGRCRAPMDGGGFPRDGGFPFDGNFGGG
jgi:hypothetical protein